MILCPREQSDLHHTRNSYDQLHRIPKRCVQQPTERRPDALGQLLCRKTQHRSQWNNCQKVQDEVRCWVPAKESRGHPHRHEYQQRVDVVTEEYNCEFVVGFPHESPSSPFEIVRPLVITVDAVAIAIAVGTIPVTVDAIPVAGQKVIGLPGTSIGFNISWIAMHFSNSENTSRNLTSLTL